MWSWEIHLSLFGHNLQTFNKYLLGSISSQGIFQMAQIICGGVEKAKDYTKDTIYETLEAGGMKFQFNYAEWPSKLL